MDMERVIPIAVQDDLPVPESTPAPRLAMPVSKATTLAKGYLQQLSDSEEDDSGYREALNALVASLCAQQTVSGDPDDFHNFVVALARRDEYDLACQVLERALALFPKNVDLLADYLQYGVNCGRTAECQKYFKILAKIPKMRWTWRGFSFAIRFLLHLTGDSDSEKDILAKRSQMEALSQEFHRRFPYSEEAFRVDAVVCQEFNEPDAELEVLRQALSRLKVCPKCALRCADLLFERGEYTQAMDAIRRAIQDANQAQSSISEGYIYYLSALCKIAIAQSAAIPREREPVYDIYADFEIALGELREDSSYSGVIRTKAGTLARKSGIPIPPEYSRLYEACPAE